MTDIQVLLQDNINVSLIPYVLSYGGYDHQAKNFQSMMKDITNPQFHYQYYRCYDLGGNEFLSVSKLSTPEAINKWILDCGCWEWPNGTERLCARHSHPTH